MVDRGIQRPLTVLAAPAGAGKSAVLVDWGVHGTPPGPIAWVGLEPEDSDRRRFWAGVVESLRLACQAEPIASLQVPPTGPVDVVLPELLTAIDSLETPIVLVLDDLHEVGGGVIHADLARVLRRPPANLRILAATRVDPLIGLDRLRVAGELTEIRGDDLAFTQEEAGELLERAGASLPEADAAALWRRTEGWAAGLRLAAAALVERPDPSAFVADFAGDDGAVADYLINEVLNAEAPDVRDFLMRASILTRLAPELVAAVTGRPDAAAMLDALHRRHAFVEPVDARRESYAMHPLFAELLRARLRYESPEITNSLNGLAADWLCEHRHYVAALRHAVAGARYELAARIASEHWLSTAMRGELGVLRRLLEQLPASRRRAEAALSLALACSYVEAGDVRRASLYRGYAEADHDPTACPRLLAMRSAVDLFIARARGDGAAARKAARGLLECVDLEDDLDTARELRAFARVNLGIAQLWSGRVRRAQGELERALAAARLIEGDWMAFTSLAYLGISLTMDGHVVAGARRAREALDLAERRGWSRTAPAGGALLTLGMAAYVRGDIAEASRSVERAASALSSAPDKPLLCGLALMRGRVLAAAGDHDSAAEVVTAAIDEVSDWPILASLLESEAATLALPLDSGVRERPVLERLNAKPDAWLETTVGLAQVMLADGEPAAAREALTDRVESSVWMMMTTPVEAWALDAIACDQLADHSAASAALENALELAEPNGCVQPLLAHLGALGPTLRRHTRVGTSHRALLDELLRMDAAPSSNGIHPALPSEALSEREKAVLRYLPTMMSNQEIASELFVSVNTVKTHLRAIYRKLDAADRRNAVRRARELELLAP